MGIPAVIDYFPPASPPARWPAKTLRIPYVLGCPLDSRQAAGPPGGQILKDLGLAGRPFLCN